MGTGAIAISVPFSCVLGLLSSLASSTMGMSSSAQLEHYKIFDQLKVIDIFHNKCW